MMVFESKTGFYLGKLQAIPAIILLSLFGILLYNLFQSAFNDKAVSFSLTYLILYGVLMSTLSTIMKWIETSIPFLAAIIQLAAIAAFIVLLLRLIRMFKGRKEENKGETKIINNDKDPLHTPNNTETTNTPTQSELKEKIIELGKLVQTFETQLRSYSALCQLILNSPNLKEEDLKKLNNERNSIQETNHKIEGVYSNITLDPNYANLNGEELNYFLNISTAVEKMIEYMNTYENKVFEKITSNRKP